MTLIQLEYILALAKYQKFSKAAEKCHVTQPTLSMQIQKTEETYGIVLFDRNTHPIKPTKMGEMVIYHAQKIMDQINNMKLVINEEKGNIVGDFRIGVIPTIMPTLVPLFLKTFNKKFPKCNLIIKELKTEDMLIQLKEKTLDFGIAVTPLQDSQIIEDILYYEPMLAYIPKNHSFGKKDFIDQNELNFNDLLLLEEGNCFRYNVLNLCGKNTHNKSVNVDSGNFNTLIKLADEGYGITILPCLFTEDLTNEYKTNLVRFKDPVPTREVSLIHHQTQFRETFKMEFIKIIKGILRGKLKFSSDNISYPHLIITNN